MQKLNWLKTVHLLVWNSLMRVAARRTSFVSYDYSSDLKIPQEASENLFEPWLKTS